MSALLADFKVCLLTFPVGEIGEGHVLVENFLRVLEPLTKEIYLITGNYPDSAIFSPKIHLRNIKHDSKRQPILIRIPKYIVTQLRISYNLARVAKKMDVVIFFLGGALLLPMLTAKLLGQSLFTPHSFLLNEKGIHLSHILSPIFDIPCYIINIYQHKSNVIKQLTYFNPIS